MPRYIDADLLIEYFGNDTQHIRDLDKDLYDLLILEIEEAPAADVQEALALLRQYNMHSDIGTAHHLFVADAAGNSVCVEWADNRMYVTETNVLNNHYLCAAKQGITSGGESNRHEAILLHWYNGHNGILTAAQMAAHSSLWSMTSTPAPPLTTSNAPPPSPIRSKSKQQSKSTCT